MKNISILIPQKAILGSIEGPRQLLTQVNQFANARRQPALFNVQLVGLKKDMPIVGGLYTIHCDKVLSEVESTDLIIIPAVDGDMAASIEANKEFIPFIVEHYQKGTEVASLCMGAFILAATGLMDGKKCTTHWVAANDFRQMFPQVQLIAEKIITDEKGIYTSGGAYSYLNIILYLIEKFVGREMAILCAKVFAIEFERSNQSRFIMFTGQKDHEDEVIKTAQNFIEQNFQDKITVDELANHLALGRRNLERRFKKATSNTVVEYIQRVKIEAVKKSLETDRKTVNELMYEVGYSDTKAFRTIFKKITGVSPIEYRNKYGIEKVRISA
ncbi:MAG: helix-turn-helix domain-containing protein [Bacteroidota bacterium]|nr:helix-turn-helix domain-containing protein [Bacteroidota bacterium]